MKNIILAVTGASGAIYAKLLIEKLGTLNKQCNNKAIVFSQIAKSISIQELGNSIEFEKQGFNEYQFNDFYAPFASGSSSYNTMIICPCSMGTIGRISSGVSSDLITRAADVFLKERKKLIIVPREAPYNTIHLKNMLTLTEAGAIICPASPSFYSNPRTIDELSQTIVDRIIDLAGFEHETFRWNEKK